MSIGVRELDRPGETWKKTCPGLISAAEAAIPIIQITKRRRWCFISEPRRGDDLTVLPSKPVGLFRSRSSFALFTAFICGADSTLLLVGESSASAPAFLSPIFRFVMSHVFARQRPAGAHTDAFHRVLTPRVTAIGSRSDAGNLPPYFFLCGFSGGGHYLMKRDD